jgi:hypothetical protein
MSVKSEKQLLAASGWLLALSDLCYPYWSVARIDFSGRACAAMTHPLEDPYQGTTKPMPSGME